MTNSLIKLCCASKEMNPITQKFYDQALERAFINHEIQSKFIISILVLIYMLLNDLASDVPSLNSMMTDSEVNYKGAIPRIVCLILFSICVFGS